MSHLPAIVGLTVALGSPLVLFAFDQDSLVARVFGQLFIATVVAVTIANVVFWERKPISTLGVRRLHWTSFLWGAGVSIVLIKLVIPLSLLFVSWLDIPAFAAGMDTIDKYPVWYRILAIIITGGIFEEIVYRGYAIERIRQITGSLSFGAFISINVFVWMHYPMWGFGAVVSLYFSATFMTLFFLWRRDLLANVVAHIFVDFSGLVLYGS